jgi:hypothetical protein
MKAEAFLAGMIGALLCGAAGWAVGRFDGRKRWYLAQVIAGLEQLPVNRSHILHERRSLRSVLA